MFLRRERAKQLIDFDSLNCGNMHPTDLDGLIDYHNEKYIILEYKLCGKDVPYGQQIALERLTNDLAKTKQTICIVADHLVYNEDEDVRAGEAVVREVYYNKEWHKATKRVTVKDYIRAFIPEWVCDGD